MKIILAVLFGLLLEGPPAWAVLGQPVASVQSDRAHLRGELRSVNRQGYSVQQITAPDGTIVKEYVSAAGMVFGVSWQGPAMPNLSQLLGSYFPEFQKAAPAASRMHRAVAVTAKDLVVESGGHLRAFRGRAYAPGLLPNNLSPAVIQ